MDLNYINASLVSLKEKERKQKYTKLGREKQGLSIDIKVIKAVINIYMKLSDKTF